MIIEMRNNHIKCIDFSKKGNKIDFHQDFYLMINEKNTPEIIERFKSMKRKMKNSSLILNNNNIIYKEIKLPFTNEKKSRFIIQNEMQNSLTNKEEIVTDIIKLQKDEDNKINRVLGCSITVKKLEAYLKLMENVGCKNIKKINVGYNALFSYCDAVNLFQDSEATLVIEISKNELKLFLFEHGVFILVRTTRINYSDVNVLATLIAEEISKMAQFSMAKSQKAINKIYYFGDIGGVEIVVNHINTHLDVQMEKILPMDNLHTPKDFNYLKYIYILGMKAGM